MSIIDGKYYLLGPISTGIEFFFTYSGKANDGNTVAYFLTIIPGSNGNPDTFVFDPRIDLAQLEGNNDPPDQGACMLSQTDKDNLTTVLDDACKSHCIDVPQSEREFCRNSQTVEQCEDQIPELIHLINIVLGTNPGCQTGTGSNSVPIGQLGIFTAQNVSGGWTFSYTLSSRPTMYLSIDTNGNLTSSSTQTTFTVSQSEYADWKGIPFLAGVGYTFKVNGKQVVAQTYTANKVTSVDESGIKVPKNITIVTTTDGNNTIGKTTNVTSTIRAVPQEIYGGSMCDGTSPGESQLLEFEWAFSGRGIPSYTDVTDCRNRFHYSYCVSGSTCGTNNCNGPCNATDGPDVCEFISSTNGFKCRKPPNNEPWYRQPWFIILMVIVGILFFVLIIVLIVKFEHKRPTVDNN